jgi:hypothetical protein
MGSRLSELIAGFGIKRLSEVEVSPQSSNQHEFNGVSGFKKLFGETKRSFRGRFIYLSDHEDDVIMDQAMLTWYDARSNHPTRSEFRLYYVSNDVMEAASHKDLLLVGMLDKNELIIVVAPEGSTSERQLLWLFESESATELFQIQDSSSFDKSISFAERIILENLGIESTPSETSYLDDMITRFGGKFPKTSEFSEYARSTLEMSPPEMSPDDLLVLCMDREHDLFKTLERHLVSEILEEGFGEDGNDVDQFISYSLSVQNRRKSRAGYSFENHLSWIFDSHDIHYTRGAITERNNKPDFIFPGSNFYNLQSFNPENLTMLGVKTSVKDRWRQVLSEADRIDRKHLITLQMSISENQTDEMIAQKLQLVIPRSIFSTYTESQQSQLISLTDFIEHVTERQNLLL